MRRSRAASACTEKARSATRPSWRRRSSAPSPWSRAATPRSSTSSPTRGECSPHGAQRNAGIPDFRPPARASIRATYEETAMVILFVRTLAAGLLALTLAGAALAQDAAGDAASPARAAGRSFPGVPARAAQRHARVLARPPLRHGGRRHVGLAARAAGAETGEGLSAAQSVARANAAV